jgi:hypothetical protein
MAGLRSFWLGALLCVSAVCAQAQGTAKTTVLMDTLRIAEMVDILRDEGLIYADFLNKDMLDGQGGAFWEGQVDRIYDTGRMQEDVRAGLHAGLTEDQTDAALAFFQTETGARIVALENAARAAMTDKDVETVAKQAYRDVAGSDDPRLAMIETFVIVNDLIERNVSGALTSNYQFYRGMVDGKAFDLSEDEMIADVWEQEAEVRADTIEWLYGYLFMAYQPLEDADLEAYVVFSQTDAGRALNAGLFDGFEKVYSDISYALGRAVALEYAASEL